MKITKWIAAAAALALASCSTAPRQAVTPPPPAPVAQELPYRWTHGNAPAAHSHAIAAFGPLALEPGEFHWVEDVPKDGEAKIVIDLLTQRFYVYRGDRLVGIAAMSSGKPGKETQLGFWKVMRKQKMGYSRKYDNAPMPFMQMYDEKGIAFHAGRNPGYPASRGCVRLPLKFAERLYAMTKIGTQVIVEG